MPPGYTGGVSLKKMLSNRAGVGMERHSIEHLMKLGTMICGTPKTVLQKISDVREKTGLGIFVANFQTGTRPIELARRNMELFAAEVLPHLQKN